MNAEPKTMSLQDMRQQAATPKEVNLPQVAAGFATLQSFELIQRVGKVWASSSLVPKEYQGNLPNCIIALEMANRIGAGILQVMQNLYVVHGRPSWSAQFLIATFNTCGRFTALRYEFTGKEGTDNWGCRANAVEKSTGELLKGPLVTIDIAKREGWYAKNGSKWQTMPEQMLRYRAASWFVRAYAPELAMGLHTADEVQDGILDIEAEPATNLEELRSQHLPEAPAIINTDVQVVDEAEYLNQAPIPDAST
jgi:hypothetical protein